MTKNKMLAWLVAAALIIAAALDAIHCLKPDSEIKQKVQPQSAFSDILFHAFLIRMQV